MAGKRIVAHEAVRIRKQYLTEVKEVSGTVRKEQWNIKDAEGQDQEILLRETDEQNAWGSSEAVQ